MSDRLNIVPDDGMVRENIINTARQCRGDRFSQLRRLFASLGPEEMSEEVFERRVNSFFTTFSDDALGTVYSLANQHNLSRHAVFQVFMDEYLGF